MVVRALTGYFELGMDENPLPSVPFNAVGYPDIVTYYRDIQKSATRSLIKQVGEEGAVLLKNEGGLPLQKPQRIAVIGEDAGPNSVGWIACGAFGANCPVGTINGTIAIGGGASVPYSIEDRLV